MFLQTQLTVGDADAVKCPAPWTGRKLRVSYKKETHVKENIYVS